ncbi:MAG: L,D-transpeptidase [Thermomicrobiales bacterium]
MRLLARLTLLAVLISLFAFVGSESTSVAAADAIPDVAPDAPTTLYYPQTHHAVGGAFMKYWTNNGGLTRFGFPVTEETSIKDTTGKQITVQFFERVRMEYHPENAGTQYEVLLGQLGRELAGSRNDQPLQAVPESTKSQLNDDGALYFPETKHTLANGFRLYWQANGGLPIYGYPLSQEFTEKNADDGNTYAVQYFERARFEWHPEVNGGSVLIGLMGKSSAQTIKANMNARDQGNLTVWAPNLSEKWIEVDLGQQRLNAHVGNAVVYTTLVSTGIPADPTPPGEYRVYTKLVKDDMTGGKAGDADYYNLPNVPSVMYFLDGGYAIHGTYWHSNFGHVMSHGCVNVSIDGAKMLFDWAPLGTRVVVHN